MLYALLDCFASLRFVGTSAAVAVLWSFCAIVLFWIWKQHHFAGKFAFLLSFAAMLWWLFAAGLEMASQGLSCKVGWALAAWPGITLLPIAWAFFIFDYTMNSHSWGSRFRSIVYVGLPLLVGFIALTNSATNLLYGVENHLVDEGQGAYVDFDHGPLFYLVAGGLYVFVLSAMGVLIFAFFRAKQHIRPFLGVLLLITAAPLVVNAAYILWDFTFYGFDPTPFMFAIVLIAFSWLLANNTMMDTLAQGRELRFYASKDPVIIVDNAGHFAGANPAAEKLLCLPKPGDPVGHLEAVGPILTTLSGSTRRSDQLQSVELNNRIYEPSIIPIESPIPPTGNELGWVLSLNDVTERERYAEFLKGQAAHADHANRAKSEFLAVMSHELRSPLTSVKGAIDLVLHGAAGTVNEPVEHLLKMAQRNANRLQRLINDVLDLQKLELNELELEPLHLDPVEFLRETLEEYETSAANANVKLLAEFNDVETQVYVDPDRLKQVVGNVLSNAIKFSKAGGQVKCSVQLDGDLVRLSVQDAGIGIPKGAEEQVFGRFHQVAHSETRPTEGSGLGMHIARTFIERMKGKIYYESELGEGTTFKIDLPVETNPNPTSVNLNRDVAPQNRKAS